MCVLCDFLSEIFHICLSVFCVVRSSLGQNSLHVDHISAPLRQHAAAGGGRVCTVFESDNSNIFCN